MMSESPERQEQVYVYRLQVYQTLPFQKAAKHNTLGSAVARTGPAVKLDPLSVDKKQILPGSVMDKNKSYLGQ